jgi:hypothetical protein
MAGNRIFPGSNHPVDIGFVLLRARGVVARAASGGAAHRRGAGR